MEKTIEKIGVLGILKNTWVDYWNEINKESLAAAKSIGFLNEEIDKYNHVVRNTRHKR